MATFFALTVDTEEEWPWGQTWPTANPSVRNIGRLPRLQHLCDRFGVAVTYFANHAVLEDEAARAVLLDLARRENVEVGLHIHPWNTPPLDPDAPVRTRDTFLHNLPEDLIRAKLQSVYDRFVQCGLRPTSFRGGRYSSGPVVQEFLREHGFVADSSVVPFTTWDEEGAPDYRRRGLEPVRLPPRHPGDEPLWEVPLTLAFTRRPYAFWRACYGFIERSGLGQLRLIGLAEKLGLVRKVWLNFEDPLGRDMLPFLHKLRKRGLPCVCFTLHSSSLLAGGNPYTVTPADEERLLAQMEEVFRTLASWPDFQPATVTAIARELEARHHACTRH